MDSWRYEPTADFDQAPIQRLKNFPRHPDMTIYAARSVAQGGSHRMLSGTVKTGP